MAPPLPTSSGLVSPANGSVPAVDPASSSRPSSPDHHPTDPRTHHSSALSMHSRKRSRGDVTLDPPDEPDEPSLPSVVAVAGGFTPLAKRGRQSPSRAPHDAAARGSPPRRGSPTSHVATSVDLADRPTKKQKTPPPRGMVIDTSEDQAISRTPSPSNSTHNHLAESQVRSRPSPGSSASGELPTETHAKGLVTSNDISTVKEIIADSFDEGALRPDAAVPKEGKEVKAVRRAVGEIEVIEGMDTDQPIAITKKPSHEEMADQAEPLPEKSNENAEPQPSHETLASSQPEPLGFARFEKYKNPWPTANQPTAEAKALFGPASDANPLSSASQGQPLTNKSTKPDTFSNVFGKYKDPWPTAQPTAEATALFGSAPTESKSKSDTPAKVDTFTATFGKYANSNPWAAAGKTTSDAQALFGSPSSDCAPSSALASLNKSTAFGRGNAFGTTAIVEESPGAGFLASKPNLSAKPIPESPAQTQQQGFGRFAAGASTFQGFSTPPLPTSGQDSTSKDQSINVDQKDTTSSLSDAVKPASTSDQRFLGAGASSDDTSKWSEQDKSNGHLALGGVREDDRLQGFERQDVPSGEEGWDLVHTVHCKLHILEGDLQWHERGFGPLKVLRRDSKTYRLVMRSKGVHRLLLNGLLFSAFSWNAASEKQLRFTIPSSSTTDGNSTPTVTTTTPSSNAHNNNNNTAKMVSCLVRFPDFNHRTKFEFVLEQAVEEMKQSNALPPPPPLSAIVGTPCGSVVGSLRGGEEVDEQDEEGEEEDDEEEGERGTNSGESEGDDKV